MRVFGLFTLAAGLNHMGGHNKDHVVTFQLYWLKNTSSVPMCIFFLA
jgi:hypothetical protein